MTVVGLGAWCDFVTEEEYRHRLVRDGWPPEEVENLVEDFKRGSPLTCMSSLTLMTDAASPCTRSGGSPLGREDLRRPTMWGYLTLEHLERGVRTTVLPDDDDTQDDHPWEWLAELLRAHGVEATPRN